MFTLSQSQGEYLVRLARRVIEAELNDEPTPHVKDVDDNLMTETGVFVTLNTVSPEGKRLRGCIGYPYPVKPLVEAVMDSAHNAAFEDPRFPPVRKEEAKDIVIEVSVLTPPEALNVDPSKLPDAVKVGRDGLIIGRGFKRGLLLPQVPVEWGWNSEEFLYQTCVKAGLPGDSWLLKGTEVMAFQAIIYSERSPKGDIRLHTIS